MSIVDDWIKQVAENPGVAASGKQLVRAIAGEIDQYRGNLARMEEFAAELVEKSGALGDAVANIPLADRKTQASPSVPSSSDPVTAVLRRKRS